MRGKFQWSHQQEAWLPCPQIPRHWLHLEAAGAAERDGGRKPVRWEARAVTSALCLDGSLRVKVLAEQFCCGLLWGETSSLIERKIMAVGYFTVYRALHQMTKGCPESEHDSPWVTPREMRSFGNDLVHLYQAQRPNLGMLLGVATPGSELRRESMLEHLSFQCCSVKNFQPLSLEYQLLWQKFHLRQESNAHPPLSWWRAKASSQENCKGCPGYPTLTSPRSRNSAGVKGGLGNP